MQPTQIQTELRRVNAHLLGTPAQRDAFADKMVALEDEKARLMNEAMADAPADFQPPLTEAEVNHYFSRWQEEVTEGHAKRKRTNPHDE